MDPIKRNMKMKNVAGFHSLLGNFLEVALDEPRRSGLGIRFVQKEGCVTCMLEYCRSTIQQKRGCVEESCDLRMLNGARIILWHRADLFMVALESIPGRFQNCRRCFTEN
jgi:hypothetical protein